MPERSPEHIHEHFISEPLTPVVETADTARMGIGEPGLPGQFKWRGKTVFVKAVLRQWHDTGPCTHGSPEMYVRKHWYEVATSEGIMKVYFDRQPRRGQKPTSRWWLFSIQTLDMLPPQ